MTSPTRWRKRRLSVDRWVAGARPRTLPAAVVPVVVGAAVVIALEGIEALVWWRMVALVATTLALQVGTNYANDYSDGIRGTDTGRVGPTRLVASGLASSRSVLRAAIVSFAIAGVIGVILAAVTTWWLLVVGVISLAAGWFYTGGPRPYGYTGLGEVAVFLFFGVVGTTGSAYVYLEEIPGVALLASVPVGLLATALLVVNNLRDIPTDAAAGKRTLAVRLGAARTRLLYIGLVAGAFAMTGVLAFAVGLSGALIALGALPLATSLCRQVMGGVTGARLTQVLVGTGRLHLVFGLLLAVGIGLG